jgi:hypothetical protein
MGAVAPQKKKLPEREQFIVTNENVLFNIYGRSKTKTASFMESYFDQLSS